VPNLGLFLKGTILRTRGAEAAIILALMALFVEIG
jgi:hypothetical protein